MSSDAGLSPGTKPLLSPTASADGQQYAGSAPLDPTLGQNPKASYSDESLLKGKTEYVEASEIPAEAGPPRKYSGFVASAINLLKSIIGAGTRPSGTAGSSCVQGCFRFHLRSPLPESSLGPP